MDSRRFHSSWEAVRHLCGLGPCSCVTHDTSTLWLGSCHCAMFPSRADTMQWGGLGIKWLEEKTGFTPLQATLVQNTRPAGLCSEAAVATRDSGALPQAMPKGPLAPSLSPLSFPVCMAAVPTGCRHSQTLPHWPSHPRLLPPVCITSSLGHWLPAQLHQRP